MANPIDGTGRRALLLGGGGTIGTYVARELLAMGAEVDNVGLEESPITHARLRNCKGEVTAAFLEDFLRDRTYDAVVNFLHYPVAETYIAHHVLLAPKTAQEVFLSSIRAVGDAVHPVTEEAPLVLDLIEQGAVPDDPHFVQTDDYGLSKGRCERYLNLVSKARNFTIVRPMISSSARRLDLVLYTFQEVVAYAAEGKTLYLPEICREKTAGIEWAGNTGKLLSGLLFRKECLGQTYLLSTGHSMTWETVAQVYGELLGLKYAWIPMEEYAARGLRCGQALTYDRAYDRRADNRKVLAATGLTAADFTPFKEGIRQELRTLGVQI